MQYLVKYWATKGIQKGVFSRFEGQSKYGTFLREGAVDNMFNRHLCSEDQVFDTEKAAKDEVKKLATKKVTSLLKQIEKIQKTIVDIDKED